MTFSELLGEDIKTSGETFRFKQLSDNKGVLEISDKLLSIDLYKDYAEIEGEKVEHEDLKMIFNLEYKTLEEKKTFIETNRYLDVLVYDSDYKTREAIALKGNPKYLKMLARDKEKYVRAAVVFMDKSLMDPNEKAELVRFVKSKEISDKTAYDEFISECAVWAWRSETDLWNWVEPKGLYDFDPKDLCEIFSSEFENCGLTKRGSKYNIKTIAKTRWVVICENEIIFEIDFNGGLFHIDGDAFNLEEMQELLNVVTSSTEEKLSFIHARKFLNYLVKDSDLEVLLELTRIRYKLEEVWKTLYRHKTSTPLVEEIYYEMVKQRFALESISKKAYSEKVLVELARQRFNLNKLVNYSNLKVRQAAVYYGARISEDEKDKTVKFIYKNRDRFGTLEDAIEAANKSGILNLIFNKTATA